MSGPERRYDGFLPGQVAIEAMGKGGFRFGGMSHRGSLLALPSGVHIWDHAAGMPVTADSLAGVFAEAEALDILVVGCGPVRLPVPVSLIAALRSRRIGLEWMDTSNAARTYNVLLAEGRRVGAALIAVD